MTRIIRSELSKDDMLDGFIILILLTGCIAGAVMVNLNPAVFNEMFANEDGSFYLNMFLTTSVDSKVLLKNTARIRLEFMLFLAMVSFTKLRKILFSIVVFMLGMCGGIMISENTIYYMQTQCFAKEYIGMLVYVFSILPQYIVYTIAILILYRYCIKKEAPTKQLVIYIIICGAIFTVGAFCEAYVCPLLIKWILSKL